MDIPYCIVKSKSRLGALVHQKTATAIALSAVRPEVRHSALTSRIASLDRPPAKRRVCRSRESTGGAPSDSSGSPRKVSRADTPPLLSQDRHEFSQIVTAVRQQYNENAKQIERTWGGGIMGPKSQAAQKKREKVLAKDARVA